jgi:hypothetical protein
MPSRKEPSKPSRSSRSARSSRPSGPAARKPATRARRPAEPELDATGDEQDEDFAAPGARPVAVGGSQAGYDDDLDDLDDAADAEDAAGAGARGAGVDAGDLGFGIYGTTATTDAPARTDDGAPHVERPLDELLTGVAAAILAASVFLPWYSYFGKGISGWASGNFGPITFFLALAAVAVIALRRFGVAVSFPLEHSLILEGVGWIAVIGVLFKKFVSLKVGPGASPASLSPSKAIFVTLIAGIAVALLGGRTSSSAPFVIRPGWYAGRAGKLGAAILGLALVLGLYFGFTNSAMPSQATTTPGSPTVLHTFPKCAKDAGFPQIAGFKVASAIESGPTNPYCYVISSATMKLNAAFTRVTDALRAAKWRFSTVKLSGLATGRTLTLKAPRCGTVTVSQTKDAKNVQLIAQIVKCPAGASSATP